MTTTAMMMAKSPYSLATSETSAATRMMYTNGLLTWLRRIAQAGVLFSTGRRFSPYCLRLVRTSGVVRPEEGVLCVRLFSIMDCIRYSKKIVFPVH